MKHLKAGFTKLNRIRIFKPAWFLQAGFVQMSGRCNKMKERAMWDRVTLKNNAKEIMKKNYWMTVLVTLLFVIMTGVGISFQYSSVINSGGDDNITNSIIYENGNIDDALNGYEDSFADENHNLFDGSLFRRFISESGNIIKGLTTGQAVLLLYILTLLSVIFLVLSIFVFQPLEVGCRRWYLKNRTEKPQLEELIHVFGNGYANVVKIMFFRGLYTFLWSLLFIIPGIIKAYEYRLIPYLLAENPNMDMQEAFERSRTMMDGNKYDAFILDISFIGWIILSEVTRGILGIFYVNPYIQLTNTELYVALCQTGGSTFHSSY